MTDRAKAFAEGLVLNDLGDRNLARPEVKELNVKLRSRGVFCSLADLDRICVLSHALDAYEVAAWVPVTDDLSTRPPNLLAVLIAREHGVAQARYSVVDPQRMRLARGQRRASHALAPDASGPPNRNGGRAMGSGMSDDLPTFIEALDPDFADEAWGYKIRFTEERWVFVRVVAIGAVGEFPDQQRIRIYVGVGPRTGPNSLGDTRIWGEDPDSNVLFLPPLVDPKSVAAKREVFERLALIPPKSALALWTPKQINFANKCGALMNEVAAVFLMMEGPRVAPARLVEFARKFVSQTKVYDDRIVAVAGKTVGRQGSVVDEEALVQGIALVLANFERPGRTMP